MAVQFGHALDERVDALLHWLLDAQLNDGGWNCAADHVGCRVSSFHTTLSVLEGFQDCSDSSDERARLLSKAARRGREYFLRHRLYRSEQTGAEVRPSFSRFSFPPRWYFDVLRALDLFQKSAASWDPRITDAVDVVRDRRTKNGRWKVQNHHTGREFFSLEKTGTESRWNTLRALRVLAWAER